MGTPSLSASTTVQLWWLALFTALLPLLALHGTYLMAAVESHVPWCLPYWDSCTSISRTGRHGTGYFLFKALMIPAAVLGALYWWFNGRWLRQQGAVGAGVTVLGWLGIGACLGLVLYAVVLGHIGDTFHSLRRTGVVLYFSLTFLAELLLSAALVRLPGPRVRGRRLLALCGLMLVLGLLSVVLQWLVHPLYDRIEDAFEWWFALLINLHAFGVAYLWWRTEFRARLWVA
ncbi:hypothetical protein [Marinobacter xestospongiae]|uniref:CWH43-like N-terminal domain-containing protein n=1 Tax=Marinobacter xestospongiae TaxID=994319 RepID=A0ABU3VVY7_9GAMM|nr:hypothetical protein [Marinobacter xestospongiae]MDV2078438.1 hypothetical protein [Marinobacter xestospongiae]